MVGAGMLTALQARGGSASSSADQPLTFEANWKREKLTFGERLLGFAALIKYVEMKRTGSF